MSQVTAAPHLPNDTVCYVPNPPLSCGPEEVTYPYGMGETFDPVRKERWSVNPFQNPHDSYIFF